MDWLDQAREIVAKADGLRDEHLREGVYLVMSKLDDMLHAGQWKEIDKLIERLNPETEDLDIMLTFLTSTGAGEAPKKLKNRKKFYDESYDRLSKVVTTPGVMEALKREQ